MGIFICLLIVWQIGNVICDIINSCNMKIVIKKKLIPIVINIQWQCRECQEIPCSSFLQ